MSSHGGQSSYLLIEEQYVTITVAMIFLNDRNIKYPSEI